MGLGTPRVTDSGVTASTETLLNHRSKLSPLTRCLMTSDNLFHRREKFSETTCSLDGVEWGACGVPPEKPCSLEEVSTALGVCAVLGEMREVAFK